jgi:hypothetical protein
MRKKTSGRRALLGAITAVGIAGLAQTTLAQYKIYTPGPWVVDPQENAGQTVTSNGGTVVDALTATTNNAIVAPFTQQALNVGDTLSFTATAGWNTPNIGNIQIRFGLMNSNNSSTTANWLGYVSEIPNANNGGVIGALIEPNADWVLGASHDTVPTTVTSTPTTGGGGTTTDGVSYTPTFALNLTVIPLTTSSYSISTSVVSSDGTFDWAANGVDNVSPSDASELYNEVGFFFGNGTSISTTPPQNNVTFTNVEVLYVPKGTAPPPPPPPPPVAWNVSGSGDWNTAANWNPKAVPTGVNTEADFFGAISAPATVFANKADTVGTIHFNNASEYLITGAGSLTVSTTSGTVGLIQVDQATDEIDLPITFASNSSLNVASGATLIFGNPVTVNSGVSVTHTGTGTITYQSLVDVLSGGSLSMANANFSGTLNLETGASASITANTGSVVQVSGLSIAPGGSLDINNNTLLVNYGSGADPAATIRGELISGAITSSALAANPNGFSIGYADGGNAVDQANTGVPAGEVEIKYTVAGDINLDGSVDLSDLVILASDFGQSGADWAEGDVNYDGKVDLSDLVILASNFGASLSSVPTSGFSSSFAAEWQLALAEVHGADVGVPEPATISMTLIAAAGLLARRRARTDNIRPSNV